MDVWVDAAGVQLAGMLTVPSAANGLVVFAHGSGSSRTSPRNVAVAEALGRRDFATLLFDLLTEAEDELDRRTASLRFDIGLLAGRLTGALDWVGRQPMPGPLPVGLFGASTGAAAALTTAADRPDVVRAVVSRGGRPDLAGPALASVRAPTLLIVGGRDQQVLELNEQAAAMLGAPYEIAVVPGATHLFPEPGAMDTVCDLAGDWLERHVPVSAHGH
jgi:putative phosphoribosyl transferase